MHFQPSRRMVRAGSVCALVLSTWAVPGCQTTFMAHRAEKKVLNNFATAISEENAERARALVSEDFSETVLSKDRALEEIKRVWPVTGELEIVRVTDVEEAERENPDVPEKQVTVRDERKLETDYRLIQEPGSKKWVVDEILITSTQRGISVTKTVSEQVAFVVVVRDFAEAWRGGSREERLAMVTPECRAELEGLPDDVLNHVSSRMFPPNERSTSTDETMDEDIAIVRLRHRTGMVLLQMKRMDGTWLVDDAAFEGGKEGETIPSLRRTAVAYAAASKFLGAYASGNREELRTVTVPSFFDSTLRVAELDSVPLPTREEANKGELRVVGEQGELVVENGESTYKIVLTQTNDEENALQGTEFRVENVTIYEQNGKVKKHLAAALVAEPIANLFTDAMVQRDLSNLKVMSTRDFSERVWDHVTPELVAELPLNEFRTGDRELLSVLYKGATTEVTMIQAGRAMTVILNDESGRVKVDDLLVAVDKRPSSVKTTLSHYLPIAKLTLALKQGNIEAVRQYCTNDFNRSIWLQIEQIPPAATEAVRFLDAPLASLQTSETESTAHLGEKDFGGMISLVKHNNQWKVNEITLLAGPGDADRVALKSMLRDHLANGILFADSRPDASPAGPVRTAEANIQQVGFESKSAGSMKSSRVERTLPIADEPESITEEDDTQAEPPAKLPSSASQAEPISANGPLGAEKANALPKATIPASESGNGNSSAAPFDEPLW